MIYTPEQEQLLNLFQKMQKKLLALIQCQEAIEAANESAKNNKIYNCSFAGDMKNIFTDNFISEHGRPDLITY